MKIRSRLIASRRDNAKISHWHCPRCPTINREQNRRSTCTLSGNEQLSPAACEVNVGAVSSWPVARSSAPKYRLRHWALFVGLLDRCIISRVRSPARPFTSDTLPAPIHTWTANTNIHRDNAYARIAGFDSEWRWNEDKKSRVVNELYRWVSQSRHPNLLNHLSRKRKCSE